MLPLLLLFCGLAAFVSFGISHDIGLDLLRRNSAALSALAADRPLLAALIFWTGFALLEACGVPAGVPMMIVSGFLFGTLEGCVLSVWAATAGAVLTFLAARTGLADLLSRFAGGRMQDIQRGFQRNAFFFLLSTRLLPFFPFFAVNLVAGTFNIALGPFVVASLVGLVPAALVYAGLGAGLGEVFAVGGEIQLSLIYQPRILVPLVCLAVLTLLPAVVRIGRGKAASVRDDGFEPEK